MPSAVGRRDGAVVGMKAGYAQEVQTLGQRQRAHDAPLARGAARHDARANRLELAIEQRQRAAHAVLRARDDPTGGHVHGADERWARPIRGDLKGFGPGCGQGHLFMRTMLLAGLPPPIPDVRQGRRLAKKNRARASFSTRRSSSLR